jgi:hypothetical protein
MADLFEGQAVVKRRVVFAVVQLVPDIGGFVAF